MSHAFNIQPELNLVAVRFTGLISLEEEAAGLEDVLVDDRLSPDFRFLVDRSGSRMTASPDDFPAIVERVQRHQPSLGKPRIAVVADAEYDFGILRMFEMTAEDKIDHNFAVFRTVAEACRWLEVDPEDVVWPAGQ